MGFTVYASCHVRKNSGSASAAVDAMRQLDHKSLLVPGADPIYARFEDLSVVEAVAGFDKAAWLFSKVQFALNPPLAQLIFILRLRRIARRFGDDVYVRLNDDGGDIGDARRVHLSDILGRAAIGVITAPIWLLLILGGILVRLRK